MAERYPEADEGARRRASLGCLALLVLLGVAGYLAFQLVPTELRRLDTVDPGPLSDLDPTSEPLADEVSIPSGLVEHAERVVDPIATAHPSLESARRAAIDTQHVLVAVVAAESESLIQSEEHESWATALMAESELVEVQELDTVELEGLPCVVFLDPSTMERLADDLCGELRAMEILPELDLAISALAEQISDQRP